MRVGLAAGCAERGFGFNFFLVSDGEGKLQSKNPLPPSVPGLPSALGVQRPTPTALFLRTRLPQLRNKLANYDLATVFRRYRHHQEDVLVNAVYGQGLRALARLAAGAGRDATARWASATADRVTEASLWVGCHQGLEAPMIEWVAECVTNWVEAR